MSAVWWIAKREILERVRTRWFVIVTLLGPIAIALLFIVPARLASSGDRDRTRVALSTDLAQPVAARLIDAMRANDTNLILEQTSDREETLTKRVEAKSLDGYLVVPADFADATPGKVVYHGANSTNFAAMSKLRTGVQSTALALRAEKLGLQPAAAATLAKPVAFETLHTTSRGGDTSSSALFIVGYVILFVLYLSILVYAVGVMRSVIQEKTNRVVELVVSTVKPTELMFGKLIGTGSVGLIQVAVWLASGFLLMRFSDRVLPLAGLSAKDLPLHLPSLPLSTVGVVLAFFLLGYFFYASLYAAVGAMCSSEQDAQQAQMPVLLLLMSTMIMMQSVANDPRGHNAVVLTLMPFSAPLLMPLRYILGGASGGEVALACAILLASIVLVTWIAARIYRVGILLHGKRPTLAELARWVRIK